MQSQLKAPQALRADHMVVRVKADRCRGWELTRQRCLYPCSQIWQQIAVLTGATVTGRTSR